MNAERCARGAVISALGGGAGWISLSHVYKFTMQHSTPGTHWSTGVIVAGVSELMPLGVMLNARATGKLGRFAIVLLLLAGGFSLWAQIATADPGVTGWAVAAFPTLAFMGLVKLMLGSTKVAPEQAGPEQPSVELPEPSETDATPAAAGPSFSATPGSQGGPGVEPGPAAATGELTTGPEVNTTSAATARTSRRRSGQSTSRAETAKRVQAARKELEARLGRKATQAEVGERAGCSAATVSRIENPPARKRAADPTEVHGEPVLTLVG